MGARRAQHFDGVAAAFAALTCVRCALAIVPNRSVQPSSNNFVGFLACTDSVSSEQGNGRMPTYNKYERLATELGLSDNLVSCDIPLPHLIVSPTVPAVRA